MATYAMWTVKSCTRSSAGRSVVIEKLDPPPPVEKLLSNLTEDYYDDFLAANGRDVTVVTDDPGDTVVVSLTVHG